MWKSLFYSVDTLHFSIMQPQTMGMLVSSMDMQIQGASTPLPQDALMSCLLSLPIISASQGLFQARGSPWHSLPHSHSLWACPHTCQLARCPCVFS